MNHPSGRSPESHRWSCAVLALLVVWGTDCVAQTSTQDPWWSQFRGPNGQGVMRAARVPVQFGPDQNVRWRTAIGEGQSSPVIWGDRVFFTTCSPEDDPQLTTVCVDRQRGDVLWRKSVRAGTRGRYHSMNGPASPTPAADRDHVYAYFGTHGLVCYDHDGTEIWELRLDPPSSQYGTSASPILYGDKVILLLDDNDRTSRLLALDRETGATAWEQPRPLFQAGWSTPMVWHHELRDELVVLGSRRLTAYDPATGEEIWWAGGFSTETIGIPVVGDGLLFVSDAARGGRGETEWDAELTWKMTLDDYDENDDGQIQRQEMAGGFRIPLRPDLARDETGSAIPVRADQVGGWLKSLDQDKDGVLSKADWLTTMSGFVMDSQPTLVAIRPGASGDARPAGVAWEVHSGIPEIPSPLCCDGRIYLLRDGGRLSCIEASTGKQLYRESIGAPGQYVASPIVAGDKLIVASARGVVSVIRIGDEFEILARNDFGEKILATPALAGDTIYLRTESRLYALGAE